MRRWRTAHCACSRWLRSVSITQVKLEDQPPSLMPEILSGYTFLGYVGMMDPPRARSRRRNSPSA